MTEKEKSAVMPKEFKVLKKRLDSLTKKFTKDVHAEGKKADIIVDVAVKFSIQSVQGE